MKRRPMQISDESPYPMENGRAPAKTEELSAPELEREVLGRALLDEKACAMAVQLLSKKHFWDRTHDHHLIFEAMVKLFSQGDPVNMSTVAQAADVDGLYVTELTTSVASTANVEHNARIIWQHWMGRELRRVCLGAAKAVGSHDAFEVLHGVQERLSGFVLGQSTDTHISEAVAKALERSEDWREGIQSDYTPTGFYSLDRSIGGYPKGELTTLAAHTGAGKTSLIVQIAKTLSKVQKKRETPEAVLFFSAEMNREQIAQRAASNEAQVNLRDLRSGAAPDEDYDTYDEALGRIAAMPFHVDDTPAPTFDHIKARCQQVKAQDGLSFVCVDYDEKIDSQGQTEELRVSAIAKGLKNLAKRFEVPVIALSQYSRGAYGNYDFPEDRHLRYSGKKEQESAVILHWHWPQYWVDKGVEPTNKQGETQIAGYRADKPERGYLLCTKNRFGPTGIVPLDFHPQHTRFVDFKDPEQSKSPF